MPSSTNENSLESWWSHTRKILDNQSTTIAPGEVSGPSVIVVSLEPAEGADEATGALVELLAPRLCLYNIEQSADGDPAGYRLGLLSNDGWTVIECGVILGNDWEEDSEDARDTPDEETMDRLNSLIAATAEALVAEIEVGQGCDRDGLQRLLLGRLHAATTDDADLRGALASARWDVRQLVHNSLHHDVRDRHVDQICNDAEYYARKIRDQGNGLGAMSRAARRDTVYRTLKKLDRCMTKESSRTVSDALERLLENGELSEVFSPAVSSGSLL